MPDNEDETTLSGWLLAVMPALSPWLGGDGAPVPPDRILATYQGRPLGAQMDAASAVRALVGEAARLRERVATLEAAAAPALAAVHAQTALKNN